MSVTNTSGRRKTAVARIYLKEGNGTITVNGKDYKEYFPTLPLQYIVNQAFIVTEVTGQFDVTVNVAGGGVKGQADAIKLAIARALIKENEELRPALKKASLLIRDPRTVERKKPGLRKARKKSQFSKR